MAVQRISPSEYFGNQTTLEYPTLQTEGKDHTALIIFGGICVVAVVAMLLAYMKKK